ncbi:MAG: extracellular solute-binding protein [Anaerolineaceae bacterium]|nr:extracellular solute-binding protein [Anaerolineaceae bacterium]MCB9102011.1 extracellular solute-binding protein [Anaerolineales bacterium]
MSKFFLILLGLVLIIVTGCQNAPSDTPRISGRALLWHGWTGDEAAFLEQLVHNFSEINPQTRIVTIAVPADELLAQYEASTAQGIGPDLVIGSNDWVRQLVEAGHIRPIPADEITRNDYRPNTLAALSYQDQLWGYPMSVQPVALYYNKRLVAAPPKTLNELLAEVSAEKSIAFVPRFEDAHWGVQIFGPELFDDSGRFTLASSGLTKWLSWLNEAQGNAGVILNRDGAALQRLFIEEKIAFYVAKPTELSLLREALGEDNLGVAALPGGDDEPAGPLLPVEAIMLSTASTEHQAELATNLARYLTNPEQTRTLMRTLNRIPANRQVTVDARVHPLLAGFAQQARTAVTLPNHLHRQEFYAAGDVAYGNVLSGVLTPAEGVCAFGLAVIELQGYGPEAYDLPAGCSIESIEE